MLKDFFIYIFLISVTIIACKNDDLAEENTKKNIVGKWQLVSYCFSPGDTSCPLQNVPTKQGQILEFTLDNKVIYTKNLHETELIRCNGDYKLKEANQLDFIGECENGTKRTLYFSINNDNTATMNPQCIEACKFNFVKL